MGSWGSAVAVITATTTDYSFTYFRRPGGGGGGKGAREGRRRPLKGPESHEGAGVGVTRHLGEGSGGDPTDTGLGVGSGEESGVGREGPHVGQGGVVRPLPERATPLGCPVGVGPAVRGSLHASVVTEGRRVPGHWPFRGVDDVGLTTSGLASGRLGGQVSPWPRPPAPAGRLVGQGPWGAAGGAQARPETRGDDHLGPSRRRQSRRSQGPRRGWACGSDPEAKGGPVATSVSGRAAGAACAPPGRWRQADGIYGVSTDEGALRVGGLQDRGFPGRRGPSGVRERTPGDTARFPSRPARARDGTVGVLGLGSQGRG